MASREFLKILQSARLGDVSAQQKLASAYLTGAFKTPIQPSNALIWLEKAYFSIKNQLVSQLGPCEPEGLDIAEASPGVSEILLLISQVPIEKTFNSPSFSFGWQSFWNLTKANHKATYVAQWQLADLLLNPEKKALQDELSAWLLKQSESFDISSLKKDAKGFLASLAKSSNPFKSSAKELLIKLQPKDDHLSTLWNKWLLDKNEVALVHAAEQGLTIARLTLGLRLAKFTGEENSSQKNKSKSNASLKKAAHWLELAAKDGDRDAWYALGEIYRRPQFSGYNAQESDRCFDRAADLGHPLAQFRKGANLWRKREKIEEKVRGLQASYWVWQAHQQGVAEAKELLTKILTSCPSPKKNDWYELAQYADKAINHHAEHKLDEDWLLLCHRFLIANQFNFSKAELLLCEVGQLQHEHCVVVDIRWELPKILPRLIQIETIQQRRALLAAGKIFAGSNAEIEGNLRQRRYRFDQVTDWLNATFGKSIDKQIDSEITELDS